MEKGKLKITGFVVLFFVLGGVLFHIISRYDLYLMSIDGRVSNIRINIKESMYITVNKKEYPLGHFWPKLQRNVKVGDSVFKKPKEYDLILVKKDTNLRMLCKYRDE